MEGTTVGEGEGYMYYVVAARCFYTSPRRSLRRPVGFSSSFLHLVRRVVHFYRALAIHPSVRLPTPYALSPIPIRFLTMVDTMQQQFPGQAPANPNDNPVYHPHAGTYGAPVQTHEPQPQQPMMHAQKPAQQAGPPPPQTGEWNEGLCGCCSPVSTCLLACCVPCIRTWRPSPGCSRDRGDIWQL